MIVANKSDLSGDPDLPHESLEATAIFDWENAYVECSAKERRNINKIFKELLNQAKSRFDVSIADQNLRSPSFSQKKTEKYEEKDCCLKRRMSLPTPNKLSAKSQLSRPKVIDEDEVFCKSSKPKFPTSPSGKRRSSLAVLTQDSCQIS